MSGSEDLSDLNLDLDVSNLLNRIDSTLEKSSTNTNSNKNSNIGRIDVPNDIHNQKEEEEEEEEEVHFLDPPGEQQHNQSGKGLQHGQPLTTRSLSNTSSNSNDSDVHLSAFQSNMVDLPVQGRQNNNSGPKSGRDYHEGFGRATTTAQSHGQSGGSSSPSGYSMYPDPNTQRSNIKWSKYRRLFLKLSKEHSLVGICFYRYEVEHGFSYPLKCYFTLTTCLFVSMLSYTMDLTSSFANFCVSTLLAAFFHWGQRYIFYKFQNSFLVWPFGALLALIALLLIDVSEFMITLTSTSSSLSDAFFLFLFVLLMGLIVPEYGYLVYDYYRKKRFRNSGNRNSSLHAGFYNSEEPVDYMMELDVDSEYSTI